MPSRPCTSKRTLSASPAAGRAIMVMQGCTPALHSICTPGMLEPLVVARGPHHCCWLAQARLFCLSFARQMEENDNIPIVAAHTHALLHSSGLESRSLPTTCGPLIVVALASG